MKKNVLRLFVYIMVGMGIGWFFGYTNPVAKNQREILKDFQYFKDHTREFDAECKKRLVELDEQCADFEKRQAEYSKKAEPWMASSASIALAALKHLETNDVEDAKVRLAAMIATYHRVHSGDGDTNLLKSIERFAATNMVLSNAVYRK